MSAVGKYQDRPWSPQKYKKWLASRGPIGDWALSDCIAADRCVREHTLTNARRILRDRIRTPMIRQYLELMLETHFGSVETDDLLRHLGAYPEWIDRTDWSKTK